MSSPGFLGAASGKEPPTNAGDIRDVGSILGQEDPMEEGMQPTPVFLPGESPWIEEPGRLQSIGLQRVATTEMT